MDLVTVDTAEEKTAMTEDNVPAGTWGGGEGIPRGRKAEGSGQQSCPSGRTGPRGGVGATWAGLLQT